MTRDQAVAQILIWAAILGTPTLIALTLAWARAREIITACQCDTGRTPSPAEIADALDARDAEEAWDRLVCPCVECDWTEWEREVTR